VPRRTRPNPAAAGPRPPVNPASMSVAELARALGVPEATIRRHLDQGAPRQPGDRLNLVHYAAWLNTPGTPGSPGSC